MKKNLEILDFEDKKSQAGKRYVRFKTSDGWMSCFDTKACEDLKKFEGKIACVEITTSGDFTNIKKCYGEAEEGTTTETSTTKYETDDMDEVEVEKIPRESKSSKGTSYYTSYAKDIFVAFIAAETANGKTGELNNEIAMKQAISVVKQAKEAFE